MNKEIVPHKLVVEYDKQGDVKSGIILYRIKIDGATNNKYNSISIMGAGHSVPQFAAILKKFLKHAEKAEKIESNE